MTRLSTIVLILALTGLPVHGQDQVKRFRGDKEVDSKGTEAETPQGEAEPFGVPTKEVEPSEVPKHHANAEAEGEWVWIPYAMEGPPEGDWDDADMAAMEDSDTEDVTPGDARSFVTWGRRRRSGSSGDGRRRGGGWGSGWFGRRRS